MNKRIKTLYIVLASITLSIMTIGATYAYWTTSSYSALNAINTGSKNYSISMEITPVPEYTGFSFIPMNDEDTLKALRNKCKDKYNRGACAAYNIKVFGYSPELDSISGKIDILTDNMENISYMALEEAAEYNEDNCVSISEKNYCIKQEATPMGEGKELSLGNAYNVLGLQEKNILLVIWLTNLNKNQNATDIGNFNATVTILAGNGGEIKGTIASAITIDNHDTPSDNPTP